jgi:hypothetical protein
LEELTKSSSNRFVSAAFASCFRSFITSLVIFFIPLITNSILETVIILSFVTGMFYTFIYGKE